MNVKADSSEKAQLDDDKKEKHAATIKDEEKMDVDQHDIWNNLK